MRHAKEEKNHFAYDKGITKKTLKRKGQGEKQNFLKGWGGRGEQGVGGEGQG